MVLEFTINTSKFLELGGILLTFFGVLWMVSYTLKMVRP